MRIDKYLKNSRLIKRRTIANAACSQGRVKVNEKIAKPGTEVKAGDIVEIRFGNSISKVEILSLKEHVKKDDSRQMYKLLS